MNYAQAIQNGNGSLKFYSSYDKELVDELKLTIPFLSRRPIYTFGVFNHWLIDDKYAVDLNLLCMKFLNIDLVIPQHQTVKNIETRLIRVEYIGQPKQRQGVHGLSLLGAILRESSNNWRMSQIDKALGGLMDFQIEVELDWAVSFSESVLREWFENDDDGNINKLSTFTLYGVLAIKPSATTQQIKKSWRRQSKRYHPDINRDEDANDMMSKINDAYGILRNPRKRKKYDAGLKFQQDFENMQSGIDPENSLHITNASWKIPVRCGLILCEGHQKVNRFEVEKILNWQSIKENGKMLVSSWDSSTNELTRSWI